MNIITGRTREQDEEDGLVARRKKKSGSGGDERRQELVQLRYGSYQGLELSAAESRRVKAEECEAMLKQRRLGLVLDLDHTLLNSATYHELDPDARAALDAWARKERGLPPAGEGGSEGQGEGKIDGPGNAGGGSNSGSSSGNNGATSSGSSAGSSSTQGDAGGGSSAPSPLLFHLEHIGMWTKLRPYVHEFLSAASKLFELHVYTMGARAYAAEMVRMLDPSGTMLNADRVIAKEDSTATHTKSLDVMLGSERTTLIIDDSPAVWPRDASQLLVVRRYHFFPSSAARDASTAAGALPHLVSGDDELAKGGQLHAMLQALRDIHAEYFRRLDAQQTAATAVASAAAPPLHVKEAVRAVRRRVLEGKTLVFSHVIPLQQQRTPEAHAAWRLGTELGAQIKTSVGPGVTHVVAGSDGTDKVRWARAHKGVHAVSVEWLAACGYLWRAVDERKMPIEAAAPAAAGGREARGPHLGPHGTLPPPQM